VRLSLCISRAEAMRATYIEGFIRSISSQVGTSGWLIETEYNVKRLPKMACASVNGGDLSPKRAEDLKVLWEQQIFPPKYLSESAYL